MSNLHRQEFKDKASLAKAPPLLIAGLQGTGSIQSLFHISHWGQLPPVPQNGQMVLGTRDFDFWQLKESHSKRCWFHLNIEQNKHFHSSWIKVQCLPPAHQHCSVLGCWGGGISEEQFYFKLFLQVQVVTDNSDRKSLFNGYSIACSEWHSNFILILSP